MKKESLRKISKVKKLKENKRNNSNSVSCNNCCIVTISRNNNKSSVWFKWSNKKSTRK